MICLVLRARRRVDGVGVVVVVDRQKDWMSNINASSDFSFCTGIMLVCGLLLHPTNPSGLRPSPRPCTHYLPFRPLKG